MFIIMENILKKLLKIMKLHMKLNPNHSFLLGDMIYAKTKICDWNNIDNDLDKLKENIFKK